MSNVVYLSLNHSFFGMPDCLIIEPIVPGGYGMIGFFIYINVVTAFTMSKIKTSLFEEFYYLPRLYVS